jgi:hypothetical protein
MRGAVGAWELQVPVSGTDYTRVSVTVFACLVLSAALGVRVARFVWHVQRVRADADAGGRLGIACGVLAGAIGLAVVAVVLDKTPSVVQAALFVLWLWLGLSLAHSTSVQSDVDEDASRDAGS